MTYAGFWRRFGAMWIDGLMMLPVAGLQLWGMGQARLFLPLFLVPRFVFVFYYYVYLVGRHGGTPGMRLTGLCIRRVGGSPVGYREALIRFLPVGLISVTAALGLVWPLFGLSDANYLSLDFVHRLRLISSLAPAWFHLAVDANFLWSVIGCVVMLTNRSRRALHDFIAGTVVLVEEPAEASPLPPHVLRQQEIAARY